MKSPKIWDFAATDQPTSTDGAVPCPPKLTLKNVTGRELDKLARKTAETIIDYLSDESYDSEDFVREINSQVEDIFQNLSQKLHRIQVEDFAKGIIQILHSHLQSYLKMVGSNPLNQNNVELLFPYSHPVSKGEMTMESYLDSLSHAVMKEFIPGSIQDCSAVFDLGCAAFCSQLLLKFVNCLSQPDFLLRSILQNLETTGAHCSLNSTDIPDGPTDEHYFIKDSPLVFSSPEHSETPLSGSSPCASNDDDSSKNSSDVNAFAMRKTSSPVLAGSLASNCVKSCVETGLCSSLSTATAPLLSSQAGDQQPSADESSKKKPSSLPLLSEEGRRNAAPVAVDGQSAGGSTDTDVSPVYEVILTMKVDECIILLICIPTLLLWCFRT